MIRVKCIENRPYTIMNDYGQYDPNGKHTFPFKPVPWFTEGKEYIADIADDRHFWAATGALVIAQDDNVSDLSEDDSWLTIQVMPGLYKLQGHRGVLFQIIPEVE